MKSNLLPVLILFLSSCLKSSPHLIRYELDGTSNSYEISYTDVTGDSIHVDLVTNLWRTEFTSDGEGTAKLKVRNRNHSGTAIGFIYQDGEIAEQATAGAADSIEIELKY